MTVGLALHPHVGRCSQQAEDLRELTFHFEHGEAREPGGLASPWNLKALVCRTGKSHAANEVHTSSSGMFSSLRQACPSVLLRTLTEWIRAPHTVEEGSMLHSKSTDLLVHLI